MSKVSKFLDMKRSMKFYWDEEEVAEVMPDGDLQVWTETLSPEGALAFAEWISSLYREE